MFPFASRKYFGGRLLHFKNESLTGNRPGAYCSTVRTFMLPLEVMFMKMITMTKEEHANDIFNHLKDHVCQNETPIIEIRAGKGLLTKKLLEAGVENLHVFDKRNAFKPTLMAIASEYAGRCTFHARTFNDLFFENNNIPVYDSPYLKASLPFECKKNWKDSPSVQIIGSHNNGKVLLVGLAHISKNMMYCGMGRPQLFLIIPTVHWKKLLADPKTVNYQEYQRAGLLFPDFYDYEVLGSFGPPVHYSSGSSGGQSYNEEFSTISLTPKKELEDCVDPQLLEEYLFFGTQTMNGKAKHALIIQTLEKWAPGSGKMLVANGVDCFTQFTDLSSREAINIFKLWKTTPNYKSSLFMHEFDDYLKYAKQ